MIRFSDQVIRGAFDAFCSCRGERFAKKAMKKRNTTMGSHRQFLLFAMSYFRSIFRVRFV